MTDIIASSAALPESQVAMLRELAELMIPANEHTPSASDPAIFPMILNKLLPFAQIIRPALERLNDSSRNRHGDDFLTLAPGLQLALVTSDLDAGFKAIFQTHVVTAYYADDRAMIAVGLPPRPAFPIGYEIAASDWTLTEPVRARGPIYRDAPE